MSALLSFSERKTFARCFDKSLVARLRCSSDLLGLVERHNAPLFPKKYSGADHSFFGSPLYVRLAQFFRKKNNFYVTAAAMVAGGDAFIADRSGSGDRHGGAGDGDLIQ